MSDESANAELLQLTTQIASAYVGNNTIAAGDLRLVINSVYKSLVSVDEPAANAVAPQSTPAVSIKKSVTAEFLICLECGKKLKMLKRHIRTDHDLTIETYKAKWNLPNDYPSTAPAYAAVRSQKAKELGLGLKRGDAPTRGRKPKSKV